MHDFRRLDVWHFAMDIARDTYRVTTGFPIGEQFGMQQQMRRCAVSIPSNIAEGSARGSPKDFRRFLFIAKASAAELETQLQLAEDFGFASQESSAELRRALDRCRAMLGRLIRELGRGLTDD